jgi:chromosome segregation ATPase
VEKVLADAFLDFYQKMLKPDFDAIKVKLAEHDERFSEVLGHLDSIYNRIERLEDECLTINNRLNRIEGSFERIEGSIESGNAERSDLERRVKEIKEQLTVLQTRLESVERQLGT